MKKENVALFIVGMACILMAIAGFWYNMSTFSFIVDAYEVDPDTPYFKSAYFTMSAICMACYTLLLVCGIQFLRFRTNLIWLFIIVIIFEFIYFFSISALWLSPEIGRSVAAATGVANGGLMFQLLILFPFWAPLLAMWAKGKSSAPEHPIESPVSGD